MQALPTEIILAVVDNLDDTADIRSLSRTSSNTYSICVPALFSSVSLKHLPALERFLQVVPDSYFPYIRSLDISSPDTPSLVSLLSSCSRLESLRLGLAGCPGIHILSTFSPRSGNSFLSTLKHLSISNGLSEQDSPVSERLAVYIACSLPNLQSLSLSRITRSSIHAQDLLYSYPCIPAVINDDDVPDHPVVGSRLNLPSLLRIGSLKKLSIKDTHLGDPEWESPTREEKEMQCELDNLELGGHCLETEYENGMAVMKILNVLGKSVKELSIATALPPPSPASAAATPLPPSPTSSFFSFTSSYDSDTSQTVLATPTSTITPETSHNITHLHIGPYVSLELLSDTLSHFSSSPTECISVSCFTPDLEDVSKNMEDFLSLRVCLSDDTFYASLKRVDIVVDRDDTSEGEAVRELAEFCWDLGLACRLRHVDDHDEDKGREGEGGLEKRVKEWNGCAFLDC